MNDARFVSVRSLVLVSPLVALANSEYSYFLLKCSKDISSENIWKVVGV